MEDTKKISPEEAAFILLNFSKNMAESRANDVTYTPNQVSQILNAQAVVLKDDKPIIKKWEFKVSKAWMTSDGKAYCIGNDNKVYVWLSWAEEPRWELYVTKE